MLIAQVRKHALALTGVNEEPHHHFSSFRVRRKIFVTVPPDGQHIHLFVTEEDREQALALYPQFVEKLLWGGKVVGLRITLAKATPKVVKNLVTEAWAHKSGPSKATR